MAITFAGNSQSSRKSIPLFASLFVTLLIIFTPSAAHAETAWRYWSYWNASNGTWELAMTGAADIEATDGSVQGWRYITAGLEVGEEFAPRVDANFDAICGTTTKADGLARVAVVIDFGDASDYEDGVTIPETTAECVVVETGSPSSLLLPELVEVRDESGLVCAVNNLPASGCGEEVELGTDEPTLISAPLEESQATQFFENPIFLAAIALLGALFVFLTLKKRS